MCRFAGLLTVLFVALKLTKVIAWSWFWVLSPAFIVFGGVGLFLLGVCALIALDSVKKKKVKK